MEGGLPHRDKFQFYSINFHWGSSNRQGSEHTIDGVSGTVTLPSQTRHEQIDI